MENIRRGPGMPKKRPEDKVVYNRPAVLPKTYEKLRKLAQKENVSLVEWFERHVDEW